MVGSRCSKSKAITQDNDSDVKRCFLCSSHAEKENEEDMKK